MSVPSNKDTLAQAAQRRLLIRYITAAVAAITAIMYFLIGFRVVAVLDQPENQFFGIAAGIAYVLGTVLLILYDKRAFWILGAMLQVGVIYTYFDIASQRTPQFEIWGILIRIAQLALLLLLMYLAVRQPVVQESEPNNRQALS